MDVIISVLLFCVSAIISLVLYAVTKKKWIALFVCTLLVIVSCVATFFLIVVSPYKHEDFYIPIIDFPINYDMTKADVINLLYNSDEIICSKKEDDMVVIKKEWFGVEAYLFFTFDEKNVLEIVSWSDIATDGHIAQTEIEELEKNILEYLATCYGEEKYSEGDMSYYWEQTYHCKVTFVPLKDAFMVCWYKPEMNPISVDIDLGRKRFTYTKQ